MEAAPNPYVLETRTLQLDPGSFSSQPSGGTIAAFSQPTRCCCNTYQQPVANLSLNYLLQAGDGILPAAAAYAGIDVKPGATISGEQGASISLTGDGSISIGGTLRAPGGNISVTLAAPPQDIDLGYVANLGIDITPSAVIDVSAGAPIMTPNNQGLLLGTVTGGGSVSIQANRGTVIVDSGSQIDFAGTSALLDVADASTGAYTREAVGTAGGSLTVGSVESIELLGSLHGNAGIGAAGAAAGGSLEIDLARSAPITGQPNPDAPVEIELVTSTPGPATPPVLDPGDPECRSDPARYRHRRASRSTPAAWGRRV